MLPKHLVYLERKEGGPHSLTHFDVCHVGPADTITVPSELAREAEKFITGALPGRAIQQIDRFEFKYKAPGICISSALDRAEYADYGQTVYGMVKPWGDLRLGDHTPPLIDLSDPLNMNYFNGAF